MLSCRKLRVALRKMRIGYLLLLLPRLMLCYRFLHRLLNLLTLQIPRNNLPVRPNTKEGKDIPHSGIASMESWISSP